MTSKIRDWLDDADPVIRFRLARDVTHSDLKILNKLQHEIAQEGWGKALMAHQNPNGHWGIAYYQPKWTSTHYTLLNLRMIQYPPIEPKINRIIDTILHERIGIDGGISPSDSYMRSECCITGMLLNVACYFKTPEEQLHSLIDYLISQILPDGGYNCRYPKQKVNHSSVHTTICVLEGLWEYERNGYRYRLDEVNKARLSAQEFILCHRLFKSDKDGRIIDSHFLSMHWPAHWHYDVMRALEYFVDSNTPYDQRMQDALDWLWAQQKNGIWPLSAHYAGQRFLTFEQASRASKINTCRAMFIFAKYKSEIPSNYR